jgi:hypothetical protein
LSFTKSLAVSTAAFMTAAAAAVPSTAAPAHRAPAVHRVVAPRPAHQVHVDRHPPAGPRHDRQTGNQNLQNRNPNLRPSGQPAGAGSQQAHPLPNFTPRPGPAGSGLAAHNLLKAGPGRINASLKPGHLPVKPAFPVVSMHNRFWPILKGPKYMWFAGQRRFFVPLGLLGVALIGDSYWYPDGYVSIAGPLCTGATPDGCQLEWRMVDFEDGGSAPQCVQYCPQAGPPPARAAALPPPPALAQGGACQLTIYGDPDFGGLSAPTSDNQPLLSETGWKDEISSIQVQAGTWDFFSAENFGGESIRMSAGSYPMLAPEWNKRIESFMCVEPGAGT